MDFSNLPQNRARIYIICFLERIDADAFKAFDDLKNSIKRQTKTEREMEIRKIINYDEYVDERYYYTREKYPLYFLDNSEYNHISIDDRNEYRVNLKEQVNELYQFYQVRRGMYVRKNKSNVCPTLTANMGTGGHNVPLIFDGKGVRKITPQEAFRLQGFPIGKGYILPDEINGKRYPDSYLYKQAGNAVSVPIVTKLATEILKVLSDNDLDDQENVSNREPNETNEH
jgi:DNA (cytosine-5)-methyltransferase 1